MIIRIHKGIHNNLLYYLGLENMLNNTPLVAKNGVDAVEKESWKDAEK